MSQGVSIFMIFLNLNLHYIFKPLKVYYSPQGYWKGLAAIKKLAAAASLWWCCQKVGNKANPGKFIFPPQSAFLAPNSMYPWQMQFTKQTFFYHMTFKGMVRAGRLTNVLWQWSMSPAIWKKLNHWPWKTLLKLKAVFKKIINASLWNGHSGFRLTPAENSWALPPKKWKNKTKHSTWVPWAPLWLGDHWKV